MYNSNLFSVQPQFCAFYFLHIKKHIFNFRYRDLFNGACLRVFKEGLAHQQQRQEELELLHQALQQAKDNANVTARRYRLIY